MNLILNYEGFEDYLVKSFERTLLGGVSYIFRFPNNYGASVVKTIISYGHEDDLWELAVIKWWCDDEWDLDYDTPITDDVIGYLTDERVRELLEEIKGLE